MIEQAVRGRARRRLHHRLARLGALPARPLRGGGAADAARRRADPRRPGDQRPPRRRALEGRPQARGRVPVAPGALASARPTTSTWTASAGSSRSGSTRCSPPSRPAGRLSAGRCRRRSSPPPRSTSRCTSPAAAPTATTCSTASWSFPASATALEAEPAAGLSLADRRPLRPRARRRRRQPRAPRRARSCGRRPRRRAPADQVAAGRERHRRRLGRRRGGAAPARPALAGAAAGARGGARASAPTCRSASPGAPAGCRGIGERLEPLALPPFWLVLANPGVPLADRRGLRRPRRPRQPAAVRRRRAFADADALAAWLAAQRNDLEPAAARARARRSPRRSPRSPPSPAAASPACRAPAPPASASSPRRRPRSPPPRRSAAPDPPGGSRPRRCPDPSRCVRLLPRASLRPMVTHVGGWTRSWPPAAVIRTAPPREGTMNQPAENRSLPERVERGGLLVAPELAAFLEEEALPGTGSTGRASGRGSRRSSTSSVHGTARCSSGATSCRRRSTPGTSSTATSRTTARPTRPSSPRSATCCPRATTSPSRPRTSTPRSRACPGRSSWCRSPTPASRSTRRTRAGAASTTASTAPTRWAARRRPAATTGAGARGWSRGRGCSSTRRFRSPAPAMPTRGATTCAAARCSSTTCRCMRAGEVRRLPRPSARAGGGAPAQQRAARRAGLRPHPSDRQPRPGRARRRAAGERGLGDHGLRGLGRLRRRRGQGGRLPQLARPDEGRPVGDLREGRPDAHPQPQPGPDLHRPGRRRGLGQGPRADAGAQRRAPDDQPRDPRPRRRRGLRGADGRDGDDADRAARPEEDGRRRATRSPGRSTWSSRRCTAPTRWPSPTRPSPASRRCSGCRATP